MPRSKPPVTTAADRQIARLRAKVAELEAHRATTLTDLDIGRLKTIIARDVQESEIFPGSFGHGEYGLLARWILRAHGIGVRCNGDTGEVTFSDAENEA